MLKLSPLAWKIIAALSHLFFVVMGCLLQIVLWAVGMINELVLMYRCGLVMFVPLLVWAITLKTTKDHEKAAYAIIAAGGVIIFWTMMMTQMNR